MQVLDLIHINTFPCQVFYNCDIQQFYQDVYQSKSLKSRVSVYCSYLKLTSHGILHYLFSADLLKKLSSIDCVYFYFFLNRFCPVEKAFLNWLCQYLCFLDIFFSIEFAGGKVWGYPTLLLSLLYLDYIKIDYIKINVVEKLVFLFFKKTHLWLKRQLTVVNFQTQFIDNKRKLWKKQFLKISCDGVRSGKNLETFISRSSSWKLV